MEESMSSRTERWVRAGFKPGAIIDGKELVSYPWSQSPYVLVNARNIPNEPWTMETFEITDNGRLILHKESEPRPSRLAQAINILEAINEFYQAQGNVEEPLWPSAQILDGEVSIKDAIADCLGSE
jgi:hypothetical protein